jgi:hypothetical protein
MSLPDVLNGNADGLSLLAVVATLVLLVALERWIHQHIHGVAYLFTRNKDAAILLYAVPLFPGVVLHELSHWVMAKLLGVKTGGISLLPKRDRSGHIRLGSLVIERTDAIRASLIGIAPLFSGSLVVLYIGYRMIGVGALGNALLTGSIAAIASSFGALLRVPDMWLWLYLLFAIANAMLPSPSDRETWTPVVLFLVVIVGLAYLLGFSRVLLDLAPVVVTSLRWLAVAFGVTLVADMPFVILIASAEWLLGMMRGERVYYYQPPKKKE